MSEKKQLEKCCAGVVDDNVVLWDPDTGETEVRVKYQPVKGCKYTGMEVKVTPADDEAKSAVLFITYRVALPKAGDTRRTYFDLASESGKWAVTVRVFADCGACPWVAVGTVDTFGE